jgi:hypothetical protein
VVCQDHTIRTREHRAVPVCVNGLHQQLSPLLVYALGSTSLRTRAVGRVGGPQSLYDGAIQCLRARQRQSRVTKQGTELWDPLLDRFPEG